MAAGLESFEVNVKDFQGSSVVIKVQPEWNVGMVKREIAGRTRIDPQEFRIVFAGQTLDDAAKLWDIGVQGYSTLHCIRFRGVEVRMDRNLQQAAGRLGEMPRSMSEPDSSTSSRPAHHRFYVYCKNPCGAMSPGKLRVRCADCKSTSFVLLGGPSGWEDVLTPRKLNGQCHKEGCNGTFAEFYFKCANHRTEANEECVALHMVRANTVKVECATCAEVPDLVVVFDCQQGHCMCVDCFKQYCETKLNSRQFLQRSIGYTLLCPAECPGSEVTEMHHFRILGKDLYNRYQKFGAEECILQAGGVLCPQRDCGQGLFPEDDGRRIQCPRMIGGCGFTFCRNCKSAYHDGPCQTVQQRTQQPAQQNGQLQPNPAQLQRAGWIEANERFIQDNNNIKPCPRCRAPIEKNGGCMHMTCIMARCKFEWCWICEYEWNGQCQATHWFG